MESSQLTYIGKAFIILSMFYRDMSFSYDGYFTNMKFNYGFGFYLFCILSLIYIVIILIAILGFCTYQTGVTHYYDATSISYILCTLMLIISTFRFNLLHTVEIAKDSFMDNLNNGIIIVDNADTILYMNMLASAIYPEPSANAFDQIQAVD